MAYGKCVFAGHRWGRAFAVQSPADYDAWVVNDLKFDDPKVIDAIDKFGAFSRNGSYVSGGAGAVPTTDFRDSLQGLFSSPPQC